MYWRVRWYEPARDQQALQTFLCARPGQKWEKAAQAVIREWPTAEIGYPTEAIVAATKDGDIPVGVAIFGLEPGEDGVSILSLGVVREHQYRGIGTELKLRVMTTVAEREGWPDLVQSEVHRNNVVMRRVNEKLSVEWERDPEDGEYLLTAVLVVSRRTTEADDDGGGGRVRA